MRQPDKRTSSFSQLVSIYQNSWNFYIQEPDRRLPVSPGFPLEFGFLSRPRPPSPVRLILAEPSPIRLRRRWQAIDSQPRLKGVLGYVHSNWGIGLLIQMTPNPMERLLGERKSVGSLFVGPFCNRHVNIVSLVLARFTTAYTIKTVRNLT